MALKTLISFKWWFKVIRYIRNEMRNSWANERYRIELFFIVVELKVANSIPVDEFIQLFFYDWNLDDVMLRFVDDNLNFAGILCIWLELFLLLMVFERMFNSMDFFCGRSKNFVKKFCGFLFLKILIAFL